VTPLPVVHIREWSQMSPETPGVGTLLRGVRLTEADRELVGG